MIARLCSLLDCLCQLSKYPRILQTGSCKLLSSSICHNDNACRKFVESVAEVMEEGLKHDLAEKRPGSYISIMFDGAITLTEREIFCVKYMNKMWCSHYKVYWVRKTWWEKVLLNSLIVETIKSYIKFLKFFAGILHTLITVVEVYKFFILYYISEFQSPKLVQKMVSRRHQLQDSNYRSISRWSFYQLWHSGWSTNSDDKNSVWVVGCNTLCWTDIAWNCL